MNFFVYFNRNFAIAGVLFSVIMSSCNNSKAPETASSPEQIKHRELIQDLETKMHASLSLNTSLGRSAAQEYFRYAAAYPDDSLSAAYLFKGAQIATATEDYPGALHAYEQITTSYPAFRYSRESLYLQGFLLDNYLNDDAKAKSIYEKFLSTYSSGPYIEDTKAAIANLGKTDEELIQQIKKINGEK